MAKAAVERVQTTHTVEEYLAFERESEERHEFLDGEIRAMAGESQEHSIICVNLIAVLRNQLKGKKCFPYSPNMKLRSGHPIEQSRQKKGLFSYADLSIVCGEPKFHDKYKDVLINPTVVLEILSPSTESFDRGEKFWRYRSHIETLTDYVLVSQTLPLVEHYRKQMNDEWVLTTVNGIDKTLHLASVKCKLPLAEIYYGMNLYTQATATKTSKGKKSSKRLAKSKRSVKH